MNKILLISALVILTLIGCKKNTTNDMCLNYHILVVDQEKIIDEQIHEIRRLKERLDLVEEYIKLLELEKGNY